MSDDSPLRQRFSAALEFTKDAKATTSDGTLTVKGYASTWAEDRDKEAVAPDAYDGSWDRFIGSNPMMLYQHNPDWPLGSFADGTVDEYGLGVTGKVPKPAEGEIPELVTAYHKIATGVLRTFSVGGFMETISKAGKRVIAKIDLFEISVVSIPANGEALFQVAKRLADGDDHIELAARARSQMEQLLGFRPLTDPELKAMTPEQVAGHYSELGELFEQAYGEPAPPQDAYLKVLRAMNAGADTKIVARAASTLVKSFYRIDVPEAEDTKAGRVLSGVNEGKLKKARQHIDDVLASTAATPQLADDADVAGIGEPLDVPVNPLTQLPKALEQLVPGSTAGRAYRRDEKSYGELRDALQAAVADTQPAGDDDFAHYVCVEDFSDSWVVYYTDGHTYRCNFNRDPDGNVQLGKPVEVRPVTSYVELAVEFDRQGAAIIDTGQKGALPLRDLPVAPADTEWDADAARLRVEEWSESDGSPSLKYAHAFLYRDGAGSDFGEYQHQVADVIDGQLHYVPAAVEVAAATAAGDVKAALAPKLEVLGGLTASGS